MGLLMGGAVDLAAVYKDLHANPELGFRETRTAALVSAQLSASGFEVTTGVGGTGVVGLLEADNPPPAPGVIAIVPPSVAPSTLKDGDQALCPFGAFPSTATLLPRSTFCGHPNVRL